MFCFNFCSYCETVSKSSLSIDVLNSPGAGPNMMKEWEDGGWGVSGNKGRSARF